MSIWGEHRTFRLCHLLAGTASQPGNRSQLWGPKGPDPSICRGNLPKKCPEGSEEGLSLGKPFPPKRMTPARGGEEVQDECVPCMERCSALCWVSVGSRCLGPPQLPRPRIIWEAQIWEAEGWSWGVRVAEMSTGQGGRWRGHR